MAIIFSRLNRLSFIAEALCKYFNALSGLPFVSNIRKEIGGLQKAYRVRTCYFRSQHFSRIPAAESRFPFAL